MSSKSCAEGIAVYKSWQSPRGTHLSNIETSMSIPLPCLIQSSVTRSSSVKHRSPAIRTPTVTTLPAHQISVGRRSQCGLLSWFVSPRPLVGLHRSMRSSPSTLQGGVPYLLLHEGSLPPGFMTTFPPTLGRSVFSRSWRDRESVVATETATASSPDCRAVPGAALPFFS